MILKDMLPLILMFIACKGNPLELALTPESGAMNVMHWFTSPDFKTWNYEGPIAWGVTSLGAHQIDDDTLGITLIQEVRPPTWWEQRFPVVYGYHFDGTSFTPTSWSISDSATKSYIDPQMYNGEMWYISPPGYTGDPAKAPSTPIRSSSGQMHYEAPRISDPSPVEIDGQTHVFATQNGALVHLTGNPLQPVIDPDEARHFNGTTVPFAFLHQEHLYLVAQRQFDGRRIPMISKYTAAKRWNGWKPIADIPPNIHACTSPIVAPNPSGGWVMMCIEEKRR